jgi:hypothetical protein
MRFCRPFTLTAGARDSKQAPPLTDELASNPPFSATNHVRLSSPRGPFSLDRSRGRPRVRRI